MGSANLTFGLAVIAGLASFVSPCVLPLVPAYIGYLSGQAVSAAGEGRPRVGRFHTFVHALFFVLGFSAVFVALGAAASTIGQLLFAYRDGLRYIGGVVIVLFGLALMGVFKLPLLYRDTRIQWSGRPEWGYLSSFLMGVFFSAGWTPCIGPALGAMLMLGLNQETVGQGAFLLTGYALGLGIPFAITGLAVDRVGSHLRRLQRYLRAIQIASGIFLIAIGMAILTNQLRFLARLGTFFDFGF